MKKCGCCLSLPFRAESQYCVICGARLRGLDSPSNRYDPVINDKSYANPEPNICTSINCSQHTSEYIFPTGAWHCDICGGKTTYHPLTESKSSRQYNSITPFGAKKCMCCLSLPFREESQYCVTCGAKLWNLDADSKRYAPIINDYFDASQKLNICASADCSQHISRYIFPTGVWHCDICGGNTFYHPS